jgi:DNA (cytosine-5)-methyltransferase 1
MSIVHELKDEQRAPNIIVLENVVGAITSHEGRDFQAIIESLTQLGYYTGGLVVDGASFVPQSRPRLFIVATKTPKTRFSSLISDKPSSVWHPKNLVKAHSALSDKLKKKWVWWSIPIPPKRNKDLIDVIEENPTDVKELTNAEVNRLISMMSDTNLDKLSQAKKANKLMAGGLYKRVRKQKSGEKLQRAEIRFDGTAGCLRTPSGGSSRQTLILVKNEEVRARLISRREAARLMGVPESYKLPDRYNDAYHVFGDGLVVPAVSWIEQYLLRPIQEASQSKVSLT